MSVEIVTFGCRLNAFESEVIRREADRAGLSDTIVINSCAVTNEAVAQARQSIRRLKRERPDARIVVTGCAAQTRTQMFADMAEVDRVVGNDDKMRGAAWRAARAAFDAGVAERQDRRHRHHVGEGNGAASGRWFPARPAAGVRAGAERLRPSLHVLHHSLRPRQFAVGADGRRGRAGPRLVEHGHAEIVLTGVDLTSYGADLPGAPKLGMLTKQILRHVPELKRLRISSIDSIEADRDLLDVIAGDVRLMPHLHLSLQSGDDMILKRMKRRHLRQDAIDFCAQVRRLRPDIALGADMIAGFPTETEEMFSRSRDLVGECGLTFLHVFPYSKRPGTPAARMPQVAGGEIRERAKRLRATGEAALRKRLESEIGAVRDVLIESATQGRTEHFVPVAIAGEAAGTVKRLAITGHDGARLTA